MKTLQSTVGVCIFLLFTAVCMGAENAKSPRISFTGTDITGGKITVPANNRVTVLAFLRADQPQSREALAALKNAVPDDSTAQVIVIVSGQSATDQAKAFAAKNSGCPWPVVPDPDFSASGKFSVHVWPTTVIVRPDGQQAGHLAGMPNSYAVDLQAYLESAAGKIDDASLQHRLNNHDVVHDDAAQMAGRQLQVARRLLETGDVSQAQKQLQAGLKLQPQHPGLLLCMAEVLLLNNQPKDAQAILDKLDPASAPSWQVHLLRARAFIALKQWPEAKAELPQALKLNPSPSEAHYLLGLVCEYEKDFATAANHYRLAFETTPQGAVSKLAAGNSPWGKSPP